MPVVCSRSCGVILVVVCSFLRWRRLRARGVLVIGLWSGCACGVIVLVVQFARGVFALMRCDRDVLVLMLMVFSDSWHSRGVLVLVFGASSCPWCDCGVFVIWVC